MVLEGACQQALTGTLDSVGFLIRLTDTRIMSFLLLGPDQVRRSHAPPFDGFSTSK